MKALFKTDDSYVGLVLRLALGSVFLLHGAQKTLGLFGGLGFSGTMDAFTTNGMPAILAFLIIIAESLGSLGLIFGFLTKICALSIGLIMLGAIQLVHFQHGFFMNWYGQKSGEGFEFHILALGLCLGLILTGGGKWSVDGCIMKKCSSTTSP